MHIVFSKNLVVKYLKNQKSFTTCKQSKEIRAEIIENYVIDLLCQKDKIKELEDQIANLEKFICAYEKNENRTLTTEDVKKQLADIKKILKDPSVTS